MDPEEGFVEASGLRLHYLRWGEGHLPPAVLLHATGFLARLWQPMAEALSPRFHVYAYDSRGHGDSDKTILSRSPERSEGAAEGPPHGYHWQRFVEDLQAFLDALGLREVLAVGHSGGGAAAAYLAATQPQYVSRAVLIEPIIPPLDADETGWARRQQLAAGARRRRHIWPSHDELIRSYRRRPTFARWRNDVLRLYAEHGTFRREDRQIELKCPGEIEAQIFENSSSLHTWGALPRIACPTLVMRGEHTEPYLALIAEGVSTGIPRARLAIIKGTGHLAPMERPEAVAEEILSFVQETPPS